MDKAGTLRDEGLDTEGNPTPGYRAPAPGIYPYVLRKLLGPLQLGTLLTLNAYVPWRW